MTIRLNLDELSMADELLMQAEATYGYLPRMSVRQSDDSSPDAEERAAAPHSVSGASWAHQAPLAG